MSDASSCRNAKTITDTDTENEDEPDDFGLEHLDPMPENFQLDEIEG